MALLIVLRMMSVIKIVCSKTIWTFYLMLTLVHLCQHCLFKVHHDKILLLLVFLYSNGGLCQNYSNDILFDTENLVFFCKYLVDVTWSSKFNFKCIFVFRSLITTVTKVLWTSPLSLFQDTNPIFQFSNTCI